MTITIDARRILNGGNKRDGWTDYSLWENTTSSHYLASLPYHHLSSWKVPPSPNNYHRAWQNGIVHTLKSWTHPPTTYDSWDSWKDMKKRRNAYDWWAEMSMTICICSFEWEMWIFGLNNIFNDTLGFLYE